MVVIYEQWGPLAGAASGCLEEVLGQFDALYLNYVWLLAFYGGCQSLPGVAPEPGPGYSTHARRVVLLHQAQRDQPEAETLVYSVDCAPDHDVPVKALEVVPQGEDVVTEGEPIDGARSFKARPAKVETPQFIFDPESEYVGVLFPGQKKPTVFKNAKQAFQNVLAPMNPAHEQTKDQITAAKNRREAEFKEKKLTAEIHDKAHEAAMKQFEFDGYYQPASFDKAKYDQAYRQYVSRATGADPAEVKAPAEPSEQEKKARALPEGIYTGDKPPKGYPNARRGKNGGWYVKRGNGWAPILKGKKKKAPKSKSDLSAAGVSFPPARRNVVRKKVPPFGLSGS